MDHSSADRPTAERLRQNHLADLVALHLDTEVSRYLGGVRSAEATKTCLDVNMAHWDQHGFGLWVLRIFVGAKRNPSRFETLRSNDGFRKSSSHPDLYFRISISVWR